MQYETESVFGKERSLCCLPRRGPKEIARDTSSSFTLISDCREASIWTLLSTMHRASSSRRCRAMHAWTSGSDGVWESASRLAQWARICWNAVTWKSQATTSAFARVMSNTMHMENSPGSSSDMNHVNCGLI